MGLFCSIILIAVVSLFVWQKTNIWLGREDVYIMQSTQNQHFSNEYVFTNEMGLNFAFAFTDYDSETEDILHPSYGSLVFTTYEWGEDSDGNPFTKFVEIPSHTCSREELGLEGQEKSHFYPIKEDK